MNLKLPNIWLTGTLNRCRPAIGLVSGLLLTLTSQAESPESSLSPADWLRKMGQAERTENYAGIFTYIRGSRYDNVRIVHRMEDGKEIERLFNMNGEVRELYREDDEVYCFHPIESAAHEDFADHSVHIGPFTPAFPERVLSTQDLYKLAIQGEDRIAGRSAVVLTVSPSFSDRYGYRIWVDEETGLLLQSHLIDSGRVKEIFQFTYLEVGDSVGREDLASAISGETVSHQLTLESNERTEKPVWRVKWLPDGFKPVRVQGNRLHFTDGLATFSVFVEKPGAAPMPDLATTFGGTVVITRKSKSSGSQITVVGEVPLQTAERVAESVEPVIY